MCCDILVSNEYKFYSNIEDEILAETEEVKDLSVIVDNMADFKIQRNNDIMKAKKVGCVLRTFSTRNTDNDNSGKY